jgi:hypothetical protein
VLLGELSSSGSDGRLSFSADGRQAAAVQEILRTPVTWWRGSLAS